MSWQAWTSLAAVVISLGVLAFTGLGAEYVLVAAVSVLLLAGILDPADALAGLSNEGLAAVALFFVVGAGLRDTGAIHLVFDTWLGRPTSTRRALGRIVTPIALLSAFLNNTAVVAAVLPAITDWAKKHEEALSRYLIPISYATILGGSCTLIGTSTNLVVNGLLVASGNAGMGLFELGLVGVPVALAGLIYLIAASDALLPDRRPPISELDDPREYVIEMIVQPGTPLVGKTIEDAGLRSLRNVYLMEIERDGHLRTAVSPRERLEGGDRLVFVGIVDSVVELERIRGLKVATDQVFKLDSPRDERILIEAVVGLSCPLAGVSIRDGRFRSVYNAAIIAVARDGERVRKKIGDIVLQPGDTLLLEAHPSFAHLHKNSRDFFLVSPVANSDRPRHDRAGYALAILTGLMAVVATGVLPMVTAALAAGGLMILTRCTSAVSARRAIDWQVLMVIAAALGLGRALELSGAAEHLGALVPRLAGDSPIVALTLVYLATMVATEILTNSAAAALMFPIGKAAAASLGVSLVPFAVAVMMAASASFMTPIGYQTNLMVYGPGGYKFRDYVRMGFPLSVLVAAVTLVVVPLVWPL
jgi:di/tricarboxylate transporter